MLDLEAKEGGDRLLGNGASIPVELTGTQYIKEEPEEKPPEDPKPENDPDEGTDPEENNEGGGQDNG